MLLRTYLEKHPNIQEYWLQSKEEFVLCKANDFDTLNCFGNRKIVLVEEEPDEVVTLHIR